MSDELIIARRQSLIEIDIVMERGSYAMRRWPGVPRVGDEIMLNRVEDRKLVEENALAKVTRVVWGTSSGSNEIGLHFSLRVSIVCEWVKP